MSRNFKHEDMNGLTVFITSLSVTLSVFAQTGVETDGIDTSAFDKYLDEIVIVAKKPGTIAKREGGTINSVILPVMIFATNENANTLTVENTDSLTVDTLKCQEIKNPYRFRPTQLIIPGVLIGAGFIGLESDWLKYTNHETKDELQEHHHSKLGVDDFSQYAPLAAAYGLRLCGIKGLHDYVDLTIISGTAYLLTGLSVYGVKTLTRVERPDGSTRNSFPSGHTATAFAGAEILRREYWNVSPWIGIAGYAVAAGTGFLRMYNNRHWLTDVVAGAGFGILCAQAAYWLYPVITKTLFRKRYNSNIYLSPYISSESKGIAFQLTF